MVTEATHLFFTRNEKKGGEHTGQWMLGTLESCAPDQVKFVVKARSEKYGRVRKRLRKGGEFVSNRRKIFHFTGGVKISIA